MRENMELENQNTTSCLNPTLGSGVGYRSYHNRPDINCEGWLTARSLGFPRNKACILSHTAQQFWWGRNWQTKSRSCTASKHARTWARNIASSVFRRRSCIVVSEELWNSYTSMGVMVGRRIGCRSKCKGNGKEEPQELWAAEYRS